MARPLLSVSLPVYNAARSLPLALGSLLAQTFADWELLAVDDGSSDDSLAVLHRLRDPRVRVLADGRNLGVAARLNQIAQEARGEYVARMDADDLCHPQRLEKQSAFLQQNPDTDGVGCSLLILDRQIHLAGMRLFPARHEQICSRPLDGIGIAHPSFVAQIGRAHV